MKVKGKKLGLSAKVFIGFVLGVSAGLIFGEKVLAIQFIGDLFLSLIKMITVPLVFFSIIGGITNITDMDRLKRIGGKVLFVYLLTTAISGFIGLAVGHLLQPGYGFTLESAANTAYKAKEMPSITATLLSMIPSNIFDSLVKGSMMPIIVFCGFVGVAMTALGDKVKHVHAIVNECSEIMYKITAIVMDFSPYGVGALMACTTGKYGVKVFGPLGKFIFADYLNSVVIVLVMYSFMLKIWGKVSFTSFMKKILPLWAMTASTTSSSASLPVTMNIADKEFKIDEELYGFSLPLGATVNMNAAAAFYAITVVFASQIYGIPLTIYQEIITVILTTLLSVGSPGIPGGGIVMTIMLLNTMGLPVDVAALIAGIYKIVDIAHTTINVTGDMVGTICVARGEGLINDGYTAVDQTAVALEKN